MLNVSPIGRNCSQEERDAFEVYDLKHGIRCAIMGKREDLISHVCIGDFVE